MKRYLIPLIVFMVMLGFLAVGLGLACAGTDATPQAQAPATVTMETEDQKTFYALGLALSGSIAPFNLFRGFQAK